MLVIWKLDLTSPSKVFPRWIVLGLERGRCGVKLCGMQRVGGLDFSMKPSEAGGGGCSRSFLIRTTERAGPTVEALAIRQERRID